MFDSDEPITECSLCGRNGEPPIDCEKCHGKAPTQPRGYTLSEERSGRAPQKDRYGDSGGLTPKKLNLPGT